MMDTGFFVGCDVGDEDVGTEVGAEVGNDVVNTAVLSVVVINASLLPFPAFSRNKESNLPLEMDDSRAWINAWVATAES